MAKKTMTEITNFYLTWKKSSKKNKNRAELEELIHAIDHPGSGVSAGESAIDMITSHMGDEPRNNAKKKIMKIIDSNLMKWTTKVSGVEILKIICMLEGGKEGRHGSVNPPNPWKEV